jgi:hypothetical protein
MVESIVPESSRGDGVENSIVRNYGDGIHAEGANARVQIATEQLMILSAVPWPGLVPRG